MARSDEGCFGIFGAIIILILVIAETFKGNFIPILAVTSIFLLFKIFIWWTEKTPKNDKKISDREKEIRYKPYLLGLIILGGIFANIYFKNNNRNTTTESTQPPIYPIAQPTIAKSKIKEIPKEILWKQENFGNCEFNLPENMLYKESLSTSEGKVYIDDTKYLSLTITNKPLDEDSEQKTVYDFSDNLKSIAESFNENNRRNFDDFKLENYEISSFGNINAIKIQQTSTKVSGKNIEMLITSYEIIAPPFYYDITISYPKDSIKLIETFDKINKSFKFKTNENNNLSQTETSTDSSLGYYVVINNIIDKIYFYDTPDENFPRKAFLVGDEKVYVEKISNNFGYIEFRNNRGLVSKGWVKLKYMSKVN